MWNGERRPGAVMAEPNSDGAVAVGAVFERYRGYLTMLAASQVAPRLQDRVDLSGVIQQTLFEAHQKGRELRATESGQIAAWLRQVLAHNLSDALRRLG